MSNNGMQPMNGDFLGSDGAVHNLDEFLGAGSGGAGVNISVGATTTGAPGSSANVVNSGTDRDVVLEFTVPQGLAGPQGPQGEAGPAGPQGADGTQGPAGKSITAITLTREAGEIVGGTATLDDGSTVDITVTEG